MSVEALIADARGYSSTVLSQATAALSSAQTAISAITYAGFGMTPVALPQSPDMGAPIKAPTLTDITLDLPQAPSSNMVFQDISSIDAGVAPTLSAVSPTLSLPNKPNQVAEFTATLPPIDISAISAQFPTAPSLITPVAPTLVDRAEPDKPLVSIPAFDGVKPTGMPVAPTDLEGSFISGYHAAAPEFVTAVNGYVDAELLKLNPQYHAQMSAIEAQLTKYLQGGTGLNPAVEDAIYARARSKQDAEARRVRDQALADAATRGFTMPSGALLSATQQARQAGADNNAAGAREIVVLQAEMEQKNLQFAVTTSTGLRTAMVQAMLSYMQNVTQLNGQALDYAKSILNAIVEMYNTQVKVFGLQLEAYKADVAVYEALMRGALAAVEIYKAEIQALQAMTQVDHMKVEIYRARIDVLTSMTSMYKTQVDAVVSKASLEKLKIDLFQAQVQAYGAQVQAKTAEWQGYSAAIGGEEAKARVYGTQVQAYAAQVNGYSASIAAKAEAVKAQALTNDARAKQYVAEVQGFSSIVQAKGEVARTKLENQRQEILAFQAETQAAVANYQVRSDYYKATAQIGIENARLGVTTILEGAKVIIGQARSVADVSVSSAQVYGQLAGAAVAGMNTLASQSLTQ